MQKSEAPEVALTLPVEKVVYGGAGLSRHEGRVVLTPYVLPGELVQIVVERQRKDVLEGRMVEIVQASDARTAPRCRVYGRCGGCHFQHALYDEQLELKKAMLREALQRIGKIEPPAEIPVISGEPWAYRNRIQFHIDGQKVGYLEPGSHTVVDTSECPVASPMINEGLRALRRMVRSHKFPRFVRSIEFFSNEKELQINIGETMGGQRVAKTFFDWFAEELPMAASGPIDYAANGFRFRVHYRSFFQVNRFLMERLAEAALGDATGEYCLELYAGVGLFSLPLSDRFRKVVAVESSKASIDDLEANARRSRKNVTHFRSSVDLFLENEIDPPDFLLADPPRAGLGAAVVKEMVRLAAKRVSIVSCDPATLARDLKGLIEGGYRISSVTLVDLFPQTYHLETVTHLERV